MNAAVKPTADAEAVDLSRVRATALTRARYRHEVAAPSQWNAALDVLVSHRSVRAYRPDPLADGTLEILVTAAQSAPSSSNLQVWSVVAVQDPERKARLAALAGNQKHIIEAPTLLLWLIDFTRLAQAARDTGAAGGALDYTETFLLGAVDTALAAQNAVVAAESLGLGTVYIGGMRNHPAEVAAELGLPPQVFALFGLVVGHPDVARPADVKPRLPQASVLFHEQYVQDDARREAARAYDPRLRAFQREQGMAEVDWTTLAAQRTRGPESMAGRHVIRTVLGELGFALK